jgi:hypothetical protein
MDLPVSRPSNRFLVRQRDRRWMQVLSSVLLVAGALLGALFLVGWPRLMSTSIHYDLVQLRSEVRELRRTEQRLRLELEGVRNPQSLAHRAADLGMVPPPPPETVDRLEVRR